MTFVRFSRHKLLAVIILCVVCYNEWIAFAIKSRTWPKLHESNKSIPILLVADPQILSTLSEPYYPLSIAAIWDANRFVSTAFNYAIQHTKPDIVIFLGDLINDGSIASHEDYDILAAKFKSLFPRPHAKVVFAIPGDNDVGGEGTDLVTASKISRFHSSFNSTDVISYRFLDIYHMNNIYKSSPTFAKMHIEESNRHSIVVSHYPITPAARKDMFTKLVEIAPSIIFSAHYHDSFRFISRKDNPRANQFHLLRADHASKLEINLQLKELNEISVPTCSYRMGKQVYGFGHAVIKPNGILEYCVLWLPSRFSHLWIYFILCCFCSAFYIWPLVQFISVHYKFGPDKIHKV